MIGPSRRAQGVYYTPEREARRILGPLLLEALEERAAACRDERAREALGQHLRGLTLLDPACGDGSLLASALAGLRRIEAGIGGHGVHAGQLRGIERDPAAAALARRRGFVVEVGDALALDWAAVAPGVDFVFGNPPFVGRRFRTPEQRRSLRLAWGGRPGHGVLDYATGWIIKAAELGVDAALLCTSSIAQGEQAAALWGPLSALGCRISFARRPEPWSADARVHVVVLGLTRRVDRPCRLFSGESEERPASIGPYLLADFPSAVRRARAPVVDHVPPVSYGSMANDGGHLLLREADLPGIAADPVAGPALRPLIGGRELLRGGRRWCLWFDAPPPASPAVTPRLEAVRAHRLRSPRAATREAAEAPWSFAERRPQPAPFLAAPNLCSARRRIVPMAYFPPETVCIAPHWCVPEAPLWLFAVLQSRLFRAWVGVVAGRFKADLRLSPGTVYNPFPFPPPSAALAAAGAALLEARGDRPLLELYPPDALHPQVVAAHAAIDAAVDRCFTPGPLRGEEARVRAVFQRLEPAAER